MAHLAGALLVLLAGWTAGGEFPAPPPIGPTVEVDGRLRVTIEAASRKDRSRAAALGLDIEEADAALASGIATPSAVARLRAAGFVVRSQRPLAPAIKDFPPADRAYHDYARVQARLSSIASAHPDFAALIQLGTSVRGRKLTAIRLTRGRGRKPGALFVGNHHAREHLSTEVPLLAAQWLADNADQPEVGNLLETRDIYFIPLLNPDGAEHDVETGRYRWHRKNMADNGDGSVGVDLNRNYDDHWGESGSSRWPSDDTYAGPGPFSEPESRALRDFLSARPNIKAMISYHTSGELILYPWSWTEDPLTGPALSAYRAMGAKMAGWTGYRPQQSSDLYPSSGDTCDWAWAARGVYCFTYELDGPGFYPGAAAIAPTVSKNIPAILYLIGLADDPGRAGLVTSRL
ncbi:MAG: zinc carboxypeptidase [Elusimicrobia bacterium]|nr:zinc carboxypeptidase [Elusimicrobiota bacterium]